MRTRDLQVPEDIFQEIIDYLRVDVPLLCKCALVSQKFARICRPHIYHRVELNGQRAPAEFRYKALLGALLETPSLAEHTRQLHIHLGSPYNEFSPASDRRLPVFLGFFNQLEQISLTCAISRLKQSIERPLANLFGLKSLRNITLISFPAFPAALLNYAVHVTDLVLHSVKLDVDRVLCIDPPGSSAEHVPSKKSIMLSIRECQLETIFVVEELLRGEGIFIKHHNGVETLSLAPKQLHNGLENIEPYIDLLKTIAANQGCSGTATLKNLTFTPAVSDVKYIATLGSALPSTLTTFTLDFSQMRDLRLFGRYAEELRRLFGNLSRSCPQIRKSHIKFHVYAMKLDIPPTWIPPEVTVLDSLLKSRELFPMFEEFHCSVDLNIQLLAYDRARLKEVASHYEAELRRWFPSLNEIGRLKITSGLA